MLIAGSVLCVLLILAIAYAVVKIGKISDDNDKRPPTCKP